MILIISTGKDLDRDPYKDLTGYLLGIPIQLEFSYKKSGFIVLSEATRPYKAKLALSLYLQGSTLRSTVMAFKRVEGEKSNRDIFTKFKAYSYQSF